MARRSRRVTRSPCLADAPDGGHRQVTPAGDTYLSACCTTGDPPRSLCPTTFETQLLVTDHHGRLLLRGGALPRASCVTSDSLHRCAAELARSTGCEITGLQQVCHTLDVRDPCKQTAGLIATFRSDQTL